MCSEVFISQGFLGRLHPTSILPFDEVMYFLLLKIFLCLESNISIFRIEDISIFRIENISQGFLGRVHPTSILPFVEAMYFLQLKSRNVYCGAERVTFCNKIRLNLCLSRPRPDNSHSILSHKLFRK